MKSILNVAAAAAALSLASVAGSASATTYYVDGVVLNPNGPTLTLSNPTDSGTFLAGAIGLQIANTPTSKPYTTLWVFCVDLIHEIGLGAQSPPLPYVVAPVLTKSDGPTSGSGTLLGPGVSNQIGALAELGSSIASGHAAGTPNDLEAIQGAIWQIEYGGSVTSGDSNEDNLIASYVAYGQAHGASNGDALGFYPLGAGGQGFGVTQGFSLGIPEPASWAVMILGIAGVGGVARSRRGVVAAA